VIAMGVMEQHGEHLPLGTDSLNGLRQLESLEEQ
jgi:creatinine amidohydrolase/Fe(II)-dependent formamide hydrolase-like protein